MDRLTSDIRIALRTLMRAPGFSVVAILSLALGIGLSAAVFTVANSLLLRPLPMRNQDRIVVLHGAKVDGSFPNFPLGLEASRTFEQRGNQAFQRAALFLYEGAIPTPIREDDGVSKIPFGFVSGGFFDVLGVNPIVGRTLRASDDAVGAEPVMVIGEELWRARFGGDPRILGRRVVSHVDAKMYTVVGVVPRGVDLPRGAQVWVPIRVAIGAEQWKYVAVDLVARLNPGATVENARDAMTAYFQRESVTNWERGVRGVATPLPRLILGDTRAAVIVFAVACGLLLFITCANVANLLLVRGIARQREIAVRSALGASRRQIITQLVVENAWLSVAGGALGVGVAYAAVQTFVAFAPADFPRLGEIVPDATVLLIGFGFTVLSMLLFGVAPSLSSSRVAAYSALRSDSRQSASRSSRRVAELLAAFQVALAFIVLSAAALLGRSLIALQRADLAFDPSRLLVAELTMRVDAAREQSGGGATLLERVMTNVRAIPGVGGVSPAVAAPYSGTGGWDVGPVPEGFVMRDGDALPMLNLEVVSPEYFAALSVPLLRGRAFGAGDRKGAPRVMILSQSAAERYWPNANPIGKRMKLSPTDTMAFTVVGIVPETRYRDLRTARPSMYVPLAQSIFAFTPSNLVIRVEGAPADIVPTLRRVVAETEAGVALASATPFETLLARPLAQPRLNTLLLVSFAAAAVTLCAVGLFGVMATMVRQRRHELGIRMAFGATSTDLHNMVLGRGVVLAAAGVGVGLAAGLAINRLLTSLLYGVRPTDAPTLAGVTLVLLGVGVLASLIPARATTRIDAAATLRAD